MNRFHFLISEEESEYLFFIQGQEVNLTAIFKTKNFQSNKTVLHYCHSITDCRDSHRGCAGLFSRARGIVYPVYFILS